MVNSQLCRSLPYEHRKAISVRRKRIYGYSLWSSEVQMLFIWNGVRGLHGSRQSQKFTD
jgi:hypothetical protein